MAAKVAVLECLDDQSGALSLRDLMSPLPVGFAERSVRRWLAELVEASYLRTCAEYDASSEASGFDAVRFRYRSQRREAVAEIVVNVAVGPHWRAKSA